MNKKIRQLGIQAGLIVDEWDGFNQQQLNPAEQKFAELIVRECAIIADEQCVIACDTVFGVGKELKERFGVKG